MTKFHIRANGDPGPCSAAPGNCPLKRGEDEHYPTPQEARAAYEAQKNSFEKVVHVAHEILLPKVASDFVNELSASGLKPMLVGGIVRDSLAGEDVDFKDLDIEIHGSRSVDELASTIRRLGFRPDAVGKAFGVLKIALKDGTDVDLSLPRQDNHTGVGHRGFDVVVRPDMTLSEAASRRDFTINALYYDPIAKEMLDTNNGLGDWKDRKLRHMSDAFAEDPLRVMRGMQLASRFDLGVSNETAVMAASIRGTFSELPTERIVTEWDKFFTKGQSSAAGLLALQKMGWAEHFELAGIDAQRVGTGIDEARRVAKEDGLHFPPLGAGRLLQALPPESRKRVGRLLLVQQGMVPRIADLAGTEAPNKISEAKILAWSRSMQKSKLSIGEWLVVNHDHPNEKAIRSLATKLNVSARPQPLLLDGTIVTEAFNQKPGKWVGEILSQSGKAQDNGEFSTHEGAMKWLKGLL